MSNYRSRYPIKVLIRYLYKKNRAYTIKTMSKNKKYSVPNLFFKSCICRYSNTYTNNNKLFL